MIRSRFETVSHTHLLSSSLVIFSHDYLLEHDET